jgi:hypothetical protein
MRESVRQQISFYASTPTYRVVMETHGWGAIADALGALAARGRWAEMPALITDDMLAIFAEEGEWTEILPRLRSRYAGMLNRLMLYFPGDPFAPGQVRTFNIGDAR